MPQGRTPSLRQYELDQVRRVTALCVAAPSVSQPLVGTPRVSGARLCTKGSFVNCCSRGGLTNLFRQASGDLDEIKK